MVGGMVMLVLHASVTGRAGAFPLPASVPRPSKRVLEAFYREFRHAGHSLKEIVSLPLLIDPKDHFWPLS